MYKVINIGGEDYKLEFSIEASLYNDCIEKVVELLYNVDEGQTTRDVKKLFSGISDIPNTAITCLYAGLLEHHSTESGDGRVSNLAVAKSLAKTLLRAEDSDITNWYDILSMCVEQMGEDGFFSLIGLDSLLTPAAQTEEKPKRGRKKAEKVTEI